MRGLLQHYCGLALPEAAIFGLGAGAAATFLSGPGLDPAAILFGRTSSMEQDLARNLQIDYREQTEPDDEEAWRVARAEVLAGRPTMLSGDILYLDYREFKVHFPSHRFVLLGFDDVAEQVFIADRIRPEPETCSLRALKLSRNPPEGLSTMNLWGRFHGHEIGRELVGAARDAIAQCASSMLGTDSAREPDAGPRLETPAPATGIRSVQGITAIRAFAADLPRWRDRSDAAWLSSFNASCIEKFGNGGGNFRRLYSSFLGWARELDESLVPAAAPALAWRAADAWTATSDALFAASKGDLESNPFGSAAHHAERAAELEETLFAMLADATA